MFIYVANIDCGYGNVRCEGLTQPRCISQWSLCDGLNDCPNHWDEHPEICGLFSTLLTIYSLANVRFRYLHAYYLRLSVTKVKGKGTV